MNSKPISIAPYSRYCFPSSTQCSWVIRGGRLCHNKPNVNVARRLPFHSRDCNRTSASFSLTMLMLKRERLLTTSV